MNFFLRGVVADYADAAKVRMFQNIDVDKLKLWKYDGFDKLQPPYEV